MKPGEVFWRNRTAALALSLTAAVSLISGCVDSATEPNGDDPGAEPIGVLTAAPPFTGCQYGTQTSGALYEVCFPSDWNGDLVVWAHGYVNPTEPLAIVEDEVNGQPISGIVMDLRYAYAATSYRKNGLVAAAAVEDLEDLGRRVRQDYADPRFAYLVGASEGGLSTTLSLERSTSEFDGGLPTCGPVGDFRKQLEYFGDFRVVFDYFFPGIMPGTAVQIPPAEISQDHWENVYKPAIAAAIAAEPAKTQQLLDVTGAAIDRGDPASIEATVTGILRYSLFGTNDANATLGGNPYGNAWHLYRGSGNDALLNAGVGRYTADGSALSALQAYETTGALSRPAVSLHTTSDPIVPIWHLTRYTLKAWRSGALRAFTGAPVPRYGHCDFTVPQVLAGFAALVLRVSGQNLVATSEVFASVEEEREFLELARRNGASPVVVRPKRPRPEERLR